KASEDSTSIEKNKQSPEVDTTKRTTLVEEARQCRDAFKQMKSAFEMALNSDRIVRYYATHSMELKALVHRAHELNLWENIDRHVNEDIYWDVREGEKKHGVDIIEIERIKEHFNDYQNALKDALRERTAKLFKFEKIYNVKSALEYVMKRFCSKNNIDFKLCGPFQDNILQLLLQQADFKDHLQDACRFNLVATRSKEKKEEFPYRMPYMSWWEEYYSSSSDEDTDDEDANTDDKDEDANTDDNDDDDDDDADADDDADDDTDDDADDDADTNTDDADDADDDADTNTDDKDTNTHTDDADDKDTNTHTDDTNDANDKDANTNTDDG
ncbi:8867_t:CDS:2, partial [Paraglomus brasilianum]